MPGRASPPAQVAFFAGKTLTQPPPPPVPALWAGPTNTGYLNAPGYPGSLTTWPGGSLTPGNTYSFYLDDGGLNVNADGVTFYGCAFRATAPGFANVNLNANTPVFSWCTMEPQAVSSPRPGGGVNFADSYQYGIDQNPGFTGFTVSHCDIWGFGEGMQISDPSGSSQGSPVNVSDSWIHDASDQGTGPIGPYHVDGILCNNGPVPYMTFHHNTISGPYDTNALALQTTGGGSSGTPYDHITITDNYFSGYGFMVNSGGDTNSTHVTFQGNVWADDYEPGFGPLYGASMYTLANNGAWSGNKYWAKQGTWMNKGNDGLYWWPGDGNPANSSSIIGHASDYVET
jgi:hypothetical protein